MAGIVIFCLLTLLCAVAIRSEKYRTGMLTIFLAPLVASVLFQVIAYFTDNLDALMAIAMIYSYIIGVCISTIVLITIYLLEKARKKK